MKTYLDCYPCFLRQALNAARLVDADEKQQYSVLNETMQLLQNIRPGANPPEIAHMVHRLVKDEISAIDPYKKVKDISTRQALSIYPRLKELIDNGKDPLSVALRLSIAGNIIDFGVSDHYDDLWNNVEKVLSKPYAIDDEDKIRIELSKADHVLFLADNAGETVFDRVLIETLQVPVIYAVKESPIINDAVISDAIAAGLDRSAEIISNGSDAPGTIFHLCSEEFLGIYDRAPVIIAKGQANYESLSDAGPKVFCLLQVKCPVIGKDIGAPVGGIVIRNSNRPSDD